MKLEEIENFKHSLMIRCFNCNIWGTPSNHKSGEECGNCLSKDTMAYYPISHAELLKLLAVAKAAKKSTCCTPSQELYSVLKALESDE